MDSYLEFYPGGKGINTITDRTGQVKEASYPIEWEFIHVDKVSLFKIGLGALNNIYFINKPHEEGLKAKSFSSYVPNCFDLINVKGEVPKNENIPKMLEGWWFNKTPKLSIYDDENKFISIYYEFSHFANNYVLQFEENLARGEFYLSREGKFVMLQRQISPNSCWKH